ncbi:MAG TPA: M81 family metallopeptidase [Chthonomonadaceae bacterium]|nr:M81 family metallopeptidase [Chthonomonadaceae bacterium]
MRKRVLLAGIYHETNTFLDGLTSLEAFAIRRGRALWEAHGDGSPLSAVLEVAEERGWDLLPGIDMRAMPGATVADAVVEAFWQAFCTAVDAQREKGIDGIFLVLHGAMVSESYLDVEGELLRRIRDLPALSDLPLCGVIDLHANFTQEMAQHSNALIAYRENPHVDARDAALRAAKLLDRFLESGGRPITVWRHPPILWPPTATETAAEPMWSLECLARRLEGEEGLLAVNVLAGFSFADMPACGVSFSAVTLGDPRRALGALDDLCALAFQNRALGDPREEDLETVVRRITANTPGPILLVEPADNIGAGAPGDGTQVLRALVRHGIANAGVIINDAESAAQATNRPAGETITLAIGGKSRVPGVEPLRLEVSVISKSDGRFTLEDPQSHLASMFGAQIDMGPCAVVRHKGITILLTSRKTPPFDLAQWRSQGLAPETLRVIGIKAAVAHRRAYAPIARASHTVETAGPCASNLRRLPYRHIRRPVYPLDAIESDGFPQAE